MKKITASFIAVILAAAASAQHQAVERKKINETDFNGFSCSHSQTTYDDGSTSKFFTFTFKDAKYKYTTEYGAFALFSTDSADVNKLIRDLQAASDKAGIKNENHIYYGRTYKLESYDFAETVYVTATRQDAQCELTRRQIRQVLQWLNDNKDF